jgi:diacylglycerol kinase (ATP)
MNSLLIVNPAAGQGKPSDALDLMQSVLGAFVGSVFVTQKAGDAERAARDAAGQGFDAVLVAGGDGTVNEVLNGLLTSAHGPKPLPLGLVPLGTQNVLASELGLAASDNLSALAAMLRAGKTRWLDVGKLDVGKAGERYFVLMAGFGFDAVVVREVLRPVKDLLGPAAYAFATLAALAKYQSTAISLTLDGEEIHSEAFLVVIANTASYAYRQIKLAPFAEPDDGWLDVCVFERPHMDLKRHRAMDRGLERVGFASQMVSVLARRHLRDPSVRYYRARTVVLNSQPPISGQIDGETFGETPVTIRIVRHALSVFVP